jgi:uncharacterized protein
MKRRVFLFGLATVTAGPSWAAPKPAVEKLIRAAERQIGRTVIYDPTYVVLPYPGGDVAMERGVCTDVVIRAYRDGLGIDLQKLVHEDMKANFAAYPKSWGLTKTDTNIDHRRVPNLQRFFVRNKAQLNIPVEPNGFAPGDLVTMMLPGNLPHIGIVSDRLNDVGNNAGSKPMIIHNIGGGAARDDVLGLYRITGRYRYLPVK